jgi:cation diffusion facilitator family transporter
LKQRKRVIGIRKYYEYQMSLLDFYLDDSKTVDEGAEGAMATMELDAKVARQRRLDEILAKVTLVINVTLLLAKIVASIMSNSLSVMSTVIDSAVDITSGLVIWLTMRAIVNVNPHDYPRGRTKLEPLAVVIVAIIMGVANIVMIIQSVQSIIDDKVHPEVDIATISILVVGTGLKLVLYITCIRQNSVGSMVLAQDQRNDMITNIVALTCALIGTYLWLYADPIGAILVCGYIAISWFHTAGGQIPILSGHAADGDFTTRILNVVIDHDPRIKCLDEFVCYHYGNKFLVELHVVLDPNITLKESHDISEPLQMKLERLPYVERAFVHCDYKCDAIDHDHAAAEKNKQRVTLSMAHGHAH